MSQTNHYVYGIHAVTALLANPRRATKKIYITSPVNNKKLQVLLELVQSLNLPLEQLSSQKMNEQFADFVHQGVVAAADKPASYEESDLAQLLESKNKPLLILILDGITDPHNLGACLRTADATAVDFVVIPKDKTASITPVVSKVACGAAESVPLIRVTNLVRTMEMIKQAGVWIYGAAGEEPTSLYQLDCTSSIAIVLGAEGSGLRRLTREHCDGLFALPMLGTVESLNVSVATGVSLYEVIRQRSLVMPSN